MGAVLLGRSGRWECPNCDRTLSTGSAETRTPLHPCRGLNGLMAPFVPAGTPAKVDAVERGDYVGRELPQTDADGRPYMAVVTTRDDGQDTAVLAPIAARGTS